MSTVTIDGESFAYEDGDIVLPYDLLAAAHPVDPQRYDLIFVSFPGRARIMSRPFKTVDGAEFVTARRDAPAA